jgi:hypothetical protein
VISKGSWLAAACLKRLKLTEFAAESLGADPTEEYHHDGRDEPLGGLPATVWTGGIFE